ncbi:helix-turn-helix domain-containing protein [Burkholderia plantarii]|uniref:helix-turn-helix domain-containing protein n=1 Tax=Burkholderia plantarii TaxID=41899 RepID=UPI0006D8A6A8|nr:transcriptional regulator [Burkholderia plantarii]ALK30501.1 XRE family transcriptional regulator [Burkholderia plantarii]WLE59196.1 transcriptional regulator [Burkholderia plantarii]GLZ19823.1 DNA-binding protein [Burkholderia plantarii]
MDLTIRPIRSEPDYEAALAEMAALAEAGAKPGTPGGDKLEILGCLVERYEDACLRRHAHDPIAAIRYRMEQDGLSVADLRPYIGNTNRIYEVLNGKRSLSLAMIRRLHRGLGIPADVLIGAT